ncbi:MBL fold metallo-hydrolase [Leekyejoonella antrihumi]|uniref:MBL fold metallo-hydrolase n=1 Tax=Leekyejoonella antrihumi TaxID=1660198 RepID=A0A563DRX2_9MICO|nr:MBL fold metallo-hydrolase [Leekyejoonella antrihumi]TWP32975.1 MBL fold metallo-hydrolase [Leekyejoonella antrihumi]
MTASSVSASRIVLLGTAGGPAIQDNGQRRGPASAFVVGKDIYLVDAGEGVSRRLLEAGLSPADVRAVFITHHHFDHNSDLGSVLGHAWFARRTVPMTVVGPEFTRQYCMGFQVSQELDFRVRHSSEGKVPFWPLLTVHEFSVMDCVRSGTVVYEDDNVRVSAVAVSHGVMPSVGYRIVSRDRDVAFSGDRGGGDSFEAFARDADTLVHEAILYDRIEERFRRAGVNSEVLAHLQGDHMGPPAVARTAAESGVGRLVINHLVPGDAGEVAESEWADSFDGLFSGEVLIGRDLLDV